MALNFSDPFFLTVLAGTVIAFIAIVVLTTSVWGCIQQLNKDVWGDE
jgi:uncharacterized membrane protein